MSERIRGRGTQYHDVVHEPWRVAYLGGVKNERRMDPLEKKILDLLDKHWQTMLATYKVCLTKFEQQEYVIQQICEQLDIDKDDLFRNGGNIAEKNVEKKLKEVMGSQELFEQIEGFLKKRDID